MSHYETSPREKEDEARRDEHDFGVQEFADQEERDDQMRRGGTGDREEEA